MVTKTTTDVSVVIPVYNGSQWLEECLSSVLAQSFSGTIEVSIYNDASTDSTASIIESFRGRFLSRGIGYVTGQNHEQAPKGVGWARNQAIKQSSGIYLCLQDADDVMFPARVQLQYDLAKTNTMSLVGGQYVRDPVGSTHRYNNWCNSLTPKQLYTQSYTSFGPTIIQPTWFMSRVLYNKYGPFDETGKGTPEDLIFFYKVLHGREELLRVDQPLITYRYHNNNATLFVNEGTIWQLRVDALQDHVISKWSHFTIWNAGKQGRRLYRSLKKENQQKVIAFCDVDDKKVQKQFYTHEESEVIPKPRIPIVNYRDATPPMILCVKWGLTNGEFERNLHSLNLVEGKDYYSFS